jgi:hypothetical protein
VNREIVVRSPAAGALKAARVEATWCLTSPAFAPERLWKGAVG